MLSQDSVKLFTLILFLAKVILVINYCTKFLASGEIRVSNNLPFRCIYYCPLSKIMNLGDSYDSFHSPSLTVNHSTGEMKKGLNGSKSVCI